MHSKELLQCTTSGAELALIQLFDGRLSKKEIKIKEIEAAHQSAGAHVTSPAWKAAGLPQARAHS